MPQLFKATLLSHLRELQSLCHADSAETEDARGNRCENAAHTFFEAERICAMSSNDALREGLRRFAPLVYDHDLSEEQRMALCEELSFYTAQLESMGSSEFR